MDRDFEHDLIIDTNHDRAKTTGQSRQERPPAGSKPELSDLHDRPVPEERTVYELREKSYRLNDREARMLTDIGAFRTIDKADLLRHIYKGGREVFDRDLRHLHRQNLVRIVGPKGSVTKYIALTKPAKQLAEKYLRINPRQQIYAGAVKTREMKHDATLYRLYEKVAGEMEERGQRPIRVVLDYELKRNINKALTKTKELSRQQKEERIRQIAQEHNLKVVNGKIPLPDLRIEYEHPDGERDMCDLEYVTEHYRARSLAEKSAAGFILYGSEKRGRSPYGPDLVGGLIAL
jgi:hypothetical protein